MIGLRPPMEDEDDPFDQGLFFGVAPPPPGGGGVVDAASAWRERERRARSLRLLLMFLMMLLLLDGEEQQNRRRRGTDGSSSRSRRGSGDAKKGGGAGGGAKRNTPLGRDVWTARRELDESIGRATSGSERRSDVVASNGGRDWEGEIRDWVAAKKHPGPVEEEWGGEGREEGEAEGEEDARNDGGDVEGRFDDDLLPTSSQQLRRHYGDSESDEEGGNEKIRHYPRNATGFYRGEWKRIPYKHDRFMADDRLAASSPQEGGESPASSSGPPPALRIAEPSAIASTMDLRLGERGESVGVYLLPPGSMLTTTPIDDNVTSPSFGGTEGGLVDAGPTATASDREGRRSPRPPLGLAMSRTTRRKKRRSRSSLYSAGETTAEQTAELTAASARPPPSLSLRKPGGRAALQLFLRPVPAMTELSLVEGFVKLYDGPSSASAGGFSSSTRTDVLLRVHGVMVHSIGRVSLVSNAAAGRSALVWRSGKRKSDDDDDGEGGGRTTGGDEDIEMGWGGQEEEQEEGEKEGESSQSAARVRRRRLEESVSDLLAGGGAAATIDADKNNLLAQIREDVLSLRDDAERNRSVGHFFGGSGGRGGGSEALRRVSTMRSFDQEDGWWDEDIGPDIAGAASFSRRDDSVTEGMGTASLFKRWLRSSRLLRPRRRLLQATTPKMTTKLEGTSDAVDAAPIGMRQSSAAKTEGVTATTSPRATKATAADSDFAAARSAPDQKQRDSPSHRGLEDDDVGDIGDVGIAPYPYVPDDDHRTIRTAVATSVHRKLPTRELALEGNGAGCEFELKLDASMEEWTVKRWRESASRRVWGIRELERKSLHSTMEDDIHGGEEGRGAGPDNGDDGRTKADKKREAKTAPGSTRRHYADDASTAADFASSTSAAEPVNDESLVMTLAGSIVSHECRFASYVNITAIRTDWDRTTGKAVKYSFVMMLACLVQIVVLLRQLLHTQARSVAVRVSLLCVGWQTVLDAMICAGHVMLCVLVQPLFTAFASVAFFKLLIFCVIEMKYMAIILQARDDVANGGGGTTAEEMRRRLALLHLKFYGALLTAFTGCYYAGERRRTAYALALYSFWLPQIVTNVVTEAKRPLHPYYVYGMSATRLVAPLYVLGVHDNFLREVDPDFPTDPRLCRLLFVWVAAQTAVLIAQGRYGARFMIPARFLPPKFDYGRPIPASMLPRPTVRTSDDVDGPAGRATTAIVSASDRNGSDATIGVARNRMRGNCSRAGSRDANSLGATTNRSGGISSGISATLDCVICYNEIDVHDRRKYMLAPCDHIFHRECLERWMDVKMECPICRKELPAL